MSACPTLCDVLSRDQMCLRDLPFLLFLLLLRVAMHDSSEAAVTNQGRHWLQTTSVPVGVCITKYQSCIICIVSSSCPVLSLSWSEEPHSFFKPSANVISCRLCSFMLPWHMGVLWIVACACLDIAAVYEPGSSLSLGATCGHQVPDSLLSHQRQAECPARDGDLVSCLSCLASCRLSLNI